MDTNEIINKANQQALLQKSEQATSKDKMQGSANRKAGYSLRALKRKEEAEKKIDQYLQSVNHQNNATESITKGQQIEGDIDNCV